MVCGLRRQLIRTAAANSPNIRLFYAEFTNFTSWCYTLFMKRATVTLPDDLAEAVEKYTEAQNVPPALTAVVQVALREYLQERGFLANLPAFETRTPWGSSGRSDVSINHDLYLTGLKK